MNETKRHVGVKHPRIRKPEYVEAHPDRLNVWRWEPGYWRADRGERGLEVFPTHAEAIAYAQKIAGES